MTTDEHCFKLGKIIANLHSLEFVIRIFLNHLPSAPSLGVPFGTPFWDVPVGTEIPVQDLSDYRSLGELIRAFNTAVSQGSYGSPIDLGLVDLRDTIAHGRVFYTDEPPMRLIKFGKPDNGKVRVTFNQVLDEAWFREKVLLVHDAIITAQNAYRAISGH